MIKGFEMYFLNPYPSNIEIEPLKTERMLPLLKLVWDGCSFEIINGVPFVNQCEISISQAKPIAAALAHLLEAPITVLESSSCFIKKCSNGGHASQTISHFDLNKKIYIGQSFNKKPASKSQTISKYFGCNAKEKKHAIQKFWRKCNFPPPERWSRLPINQIGSKFLTGNLTTYKKTGELKYINKTVEPVFFTNYQLLEALPQNFKQKDTFTGIKQIEHRKTSVATRLLPIYTTYHIHVNSTEAPKKRAFEEYSNAYANKCISHTTLGVEHLTYDRRYEISNQDSISNHNSFEDF